MTQDRMTGERETLWTRLGDGLRQLGDVLASPSGVSPDRANRNAATRREHF